MIENLDAFPSLGEITRAAQLVSQALSDQGIPHALIGGGALAAHGYIRMTHDIDFLIGRPGFVETRAGLLLFTCQLPGMSEGVPADYMPANTSELEEMIGRATLGFGVPVVSLKDLRQMKMRSPRARDRRDVEMIDEEIR